METDLVYDYQMWAHWKPHHTPAWFAAARRRHNQYVDIFVS